VVKAKLMIRTEASSAAVSVTIKGSDTVLPLAQKKQKS
jgi:ABC-type phosphate transport system substrate-binding protein